MDIKAIIKWALQHWWWFIVSVVICLLIGGVMFFTTTSQIKVTATLMLRHVSEKGAGPDEMMQLMGFKDNKVVGDEIKVLSSRDLMGKVIDQLDITTTYSKVKHGKQFEQYPNHDLTVNFPDTTYRMVTVDVYVKSNGSYRIVVDPMNKFAERFTVDNLSQPLQTQLGPVRVTLPEGTKKGHYRAIFIPRIAFVDMLISQLQIERLGRESNVITLTTITDSPARMVAVINSLIQFYNQESTTDKNILAIQTEKFLSNRLTVVEQELNQIEASLQTYKSSRQIANLDRTAAQYQQFGDSYEQQVANIDADLQVIEYIMTQMEKPENAYAMIPGNLLPDNGVLQSLINDYNAHVAHRNELLQTAATEQNVVVIKETELLTRKRQTIKESMSQARQTTLLHRQNLLNQRDQYNQRLASIPETERTYLELEREKTTKEKQYIYLIQQREENALLLASEAVPARVVDPAQADPGQTKPDIIKTAFMAIVLGLCFPFLIYFFGIFRKEYL